MSAQADLRQSLLQRAQELFALCDRGDKGYALREDMVYLIQEIPLSPEQIESVFDSLDADGDGKLTLEEFMDGFGMFLGIDSHPSTVSIQEDEEDEEEVLEELLDNLGARDVFTDEDYVREMWHRVRKDDPVMRSNFENFISRMAVDLKETEAEKETLQSTLKNREMENESRVQSLFVEMEEQLKREKEEAMAREQRIEQQLRDELETELHDKDQQLQELLQKHAQMEKQLKELNSEDVETKHENQKLQKDRDALESRLASSEKTLQGMKEHLNLLRKKSIEEKRKRAQAALKVSEGIALERENLVMELQSLKEMNKQLLDEKDELTQNAVQLASVHKFNQRLKSPKSQQLDNINEEMAEEIRTGYSNPEIHNHPETLDKLLADADPSYKITEVENNFSRRYGSISEADAFYMSEATEIQNPSACSNGSLSEDDLLYINRRTEIQNHPNTCKESLIEVDFLNKETEFPAHPPILYDDSKMQTDPPYKVSETENSPIILQASLTKANTQNKIPTPLNRLLTQSDPLSKNTYGYNSLEYSDTESKILLGCEEDDDVDVLCNNLNLPNKQNFYESANQAHTFGQTIPKFPGNFSEQKNIIEVSSPSRVFKVVFVGDSGVGKTSILQRFCNDDFKHTFNATIGVDFQIRTVVVDGDRIVLQLWDTAGQERFRSMTQQYFRKADGIIVAYDVTVETSFKSVRNWMHNIKEGAEENAVVLLMGNKIDLCESDADRVVKTRDGERMADEYGTLFYETSAKTGNSIQEAIEALACILKTKEDETMEQVLKLQEEMKEKKKKKCC